ncbi:hypothetical protein FAIPA1_50118 [Frankia sp. AiPs1]
MGAAEEARKEVSIEACRTKLAPGPSRPASRPGWRDTVAGRAGSGSGVRPAGIAVEDTVVAGGVRVGAAAPAAAGGLAGGVGEVRVARGAGIGFPSTGG